MYVLLQNAFFSAISLSPFIPSMSSYRDAKLPVCGLCMCLYHW